MILTNKNIHPSEILDVRVITLVNTGTNNNLVLAKIRKIVQRRKRNKPEITEKLNIECFSDDTNRNLYQNRLTQKISENGITEENDVEAALTKLHANIMESAEVALDK